MVSKGSFSSRESNTRGCRTETETATQGVARVTPGDGAQTQTMDAAHFSAFAALAGSLIGGVTVVATSWLTQHVQMRAQQFTRDLTSREALYRSFIEEACRLYADAYEHDTDTADVSKLVNLYALVSTMRILSSPGIVDHADAVVRIIIETYLAPNKTFRDLPEMLDHRSLDPLRDFSNACRDELRHRGLPRTA